MKRLVPTFRRREVSPLLPPVPTLYHGTSESYLADVLTRGLLPRGTKSGNWGKYPSHPGCVYLTVAYPFYFADHARVEGERLAVVEVNGTSLFPGQLHPDEDFISQLAERRGEEMTPERCATVRKNLWKLRHLWPASLLGLGTVCYKGAINPKAITRVCLVDSKVRPELVFDQLQPTITLVNYQLCGPYYYGMIQWLFGDRPDFPPTREDESMSQEVAEHPESTLSKMYLSRCEYRVKEQANREGIEVRQIRGVA